MTHEGKAVHRHPHHAVTAQAVPVRPHEDALREFPLPDSGDQARPQHPPRAGAGGCASDPAACAIANRAVLDAAGSLGVLIEGAGGAALVATLAALLAPTPIAVIAAQPVGDVPVATITGRIDARATGIAMDDLAMAPASFLFIIAPHDAPDLGQDLRIGAGTDPAALAHVLMAALAGKAR